MKTTNLNKKWLRFFFVVGAIAFLWPSLMRAEAKNYVLVIDAGHGGKDTGAPGSYSFEKNINLNVALAFGQLVEKNCPEVRVIYTRRSDVFIPLDERAHIANRAKADLFISIHTNALEGGKIAFGSETYTLGMARASVNLAVAKRENSVIMLEDNYRQHYSGYDPNSAESNIMYEFMQDETMKHSIELAKDIQREYVDAGRPNKGVHQGDLCVLRMSSMPGVLTELGFITTPQEEAYLNSDQGVQQLAASIFNGFQRYRQGQNAKRIVVPYAAGQQPEGTASVAESTGSEEQTQQAEPERKPAVKREKAPTRQTAEKEKPIFKIQVLSSNRRMRLDSQQFKGLSPIAFYTENGTFKYTYGEESNYSEILRLYKTVKEKFSGAFIVAFRDSERMDVNAAVREWKRERK